MTRDRVHADDVSARPANQMIFEIKLKEHYGARECVLDLQLPHRAFDRWQQLWWQTGRWRLPVRKAELVNCSSCSGGQALGIEMKSVNYSPPHLLDPASNDSCKR
eukprot:1166756-Prymnesium_polylepis.3